MAQAEGDVLRVWLSAQDTHRPRAGLAHALDRPPESIHVTLADVGGAFGSKGPPPPEAVVAAIAAIDLGRPVKWVETRSENFLAAYQGRGVEGEVELALDGDGRMLGIRARLVADTGAYLHQTTAFPPHTMGMLMTGAYDIAAADIEVVGARTDRVPTGPMRGAGRPEACYLLERTVDAAARELAIDPVELRRRNLITEFPYETPLGFTYDSGDYEQCLAKAVELVGEPPPGAGLGIALYVERAGGQWESAEMTREGDGRVIVRSSSFPHGQGHDTTYAQIVADRLGIPIEDVELRFGDSAEAPAGVGTFGGRSIADGRVGDRGRRRPARRRRAHRLRALRVGARLRLGRLRGDRRDRRGDRRADRPPDRRGRRRRHDHQPAARRGPGGRRRDPRARDRADRGVRLRRTRPAADAPRS